MKKRLHFIVIPTVLVLLAQILFLTQFWQEFELKAQDMLFHIRGPKQTSGDIVIVTIDEATFTSLEIQMPFPRSIYGRMLDNLKKAGARQVIFDILFTERSVEEEDRALVAAAERFGNVVFSGQLQHGIGDRYQQSRLISPIPFIRQSALHWGLVNISPDTDGFIRNYTLFERAGDTNYYSIGIVALANQEQFDRERNWRDFIRLESRHLRLGNNKIPIVNRNRALIQFYGEKGTFPHYSLFSVIDDGTLEETGFGDPIFQVNEFESLLERDVFEDKIVLVGATALSLHDYHQTPFTQRELMPGVEIHANFLEMVLQEDYIVPFSGALYFFLLLLSAVVFYLLYSRLKPLWSLLFLVLFAAGYGFLTFYLFTAHNLLLSVIQLPAILILTYIVGLIYQYVKASKERKAIKRTFMHYMAPDLVTELLKDPKKLKYGGSLQEVTVLFSDIRSFTTYSEKHTPEQTVAILHEYLTEMVDIILANKGIVDKFVGDEIMALYGTPIKLENNALAACKTAVQMRSKLTELQKKWKKEGKESFEIGIGVNTGKAVVGNLGSEQIFDYTAIGDTINVGARLETINKEYKTQNNIIISEFTLEKVTDLVDVRYLDEVKVKGKDIPVKIYELINIKV